MSVLSPALQPIGMTACGMCSRGPSDKLLLSLGNPSSEVVIVVGPPNDEAVAVGKCLGGVNWYLLSKLLQMSGLSAHQPFITPAMKCCGTGDAGRQECYDLYLQHEIAAYPRRLIIACGEYAQTSLLGHTSDFFKRVGVIEPSPVFKVQNALALDMGVPVMNAFAPGLAVRNPQFIDHLLALFTTATKFLAEGGIIRPEPQVYNFAATGTQTPEEFEQEIENLLLILEEMSKAKVIAADTETSGLDTTGSGLDWWTCKLLGVSLATSGSWGVWVSHQHLQDPRVHKLVVDILTNPSTTKVMHNAKFDLHVLRNTLCVVQGPIRDSMVGAHFSDENLPVSLKTQCVYRGLSRNWADDLTDPETGKKYKDFGLIPPVTLGQYAGQDTPYTLQLATETRCEALEQFSPAYNLVMRATRALERIEERGVMVDQDNLQFVEQASRRHTEQAFADLQGLTGKVPTLALQRQVKIWEDWRDGVIEDYGKDPTKGPKTAKWKVALQEAGDWVDKPVLPTPFNPGSVDQLRVLLYGVAGAKKTVRADGTPVYDGPTLDLPILKVSDDSKEDSGASTDEDALMGLLPYAADKGPQAVRLFEQVLRWRRASKVLTTYATGKYAAADGVVRTNYKLAHTVTGRLACGDNQSDNSPNMQNVPEVLRPIFRARPGMVLVDADMSQAEVRVGAALSGDQTLIGVIQEADRLYAAFEAEMTAWEVSDKSTPKPKKPADVHTMIASLVFGVPIEEVTKDQRRDAKSYTFGLMYGKDLNSLIRDFGDEAKARMVWEAFCTIFPRFVKWIEEVHAYAKKHGLVTTAWGRTRHLPMAKMSGQNLPRELLRYHKEALRQAVNTLVQSAASDITVKAVCTLVERLEEMSIPAYVILTVHDSIGVEVEEKFEDVVVKLVRECMEEPTGIPVLDLVPMRADVKVTTHWGGELDKKGLERYLLIGKVEAPEGMEDPVEAYLASL